jgi:hypothetical protein
MDFRIFKDAIQLLGLYVASDGSGKFSIKPSKDSKEGKKGTRGKFQKAINPKPDLQYDCECVFL